MKKAPSSPGERVRYTSEYIKRKAITANIPTEGVVVRVNELPTQAGIVFQADVNWNQHADQVSRTVDVNDLEVIKS